MARTNGSLEVGTTATDGTPLTLQKSANNAYSFLFHDGYVLGLGAGNCPGALFAVVLPGTAGYRTSFDLYPIGP